MASYIFGGDTGETPESIKRKRELAAALMLGNRKAPQNVGEGLNAIGQALMYRQMMGEARAAEQASLASGQQSMQGIIEGMGRSYHPPAPSMNGSVPMPEADMASARVAQAHGDNDLRSGIISTAKALGIDATDLATAISYETAGTFDPTKRGPRTQWGQHRGLIQFGEPQAKEHGVDWNNPVGSQLGPDGAVASYLRKAGVQPGMGLMDVYSAINAGGVGRYNASDANNGGAPGTVADKVNNQMAGHRQKALALLGSEPASPVPAPTSGLTPEALQAWASQNYQPSQAQTGQPSPGTQPRLQPGQPAPAMAPAQPVSDMPVAAAPDPRLEMSGNVDVPQPTGPTLQELAAALGNPHLPEHFRPIAQALLGQQMQQMDPRYGMQLEADKLGLEKSRLEIDAMRNPQPKDTDDIREYNFARQQGYQGSFTDFMTDMRRAGATSVNVGAGEKAWDQESAKLFAKRYDDITAGAANAHQMMGMYDLAEQALNTGVRTGVGAEAELTLRQLGAALGMDTDPEKLAGGELIRAVQNRMALTMRSPDGGMGMPGALSDRDIKFLKDSQIGIDRSPEGNRRMLEAFRAMEGRKIEIARLADDYIEQNGRLDSGFNRMVREHAEANPLFLEAANPNNAVPSGWEDDWQYLTPEERARVLGQ
ncbi:MAG: hypothetical protein M9945_12750 [Aquamicrobium sp.]|uniref:hypothetical protein n=1 Tax=Aquamicrobium sp. TaxID=1872579 RepID=UPI00349E9C10|nr:hypothetical protein [Aquamicrobium sp.]